MTLLPAYSKSLFVGRERPDGLRMKVQYRRGLVYSDIAVGNGFEGYENVVQGGILFGIIDVIMWYAIFMETQKICMTRKTDMDFLKPVMCDQPYRALGKLLRVEERDVWATGWIEDADHVRCAEATALFREAKGPDRTKALRRLDYSGVSPEIRERFLSSVS